MKTPDKAFGYFFLPLNRKRSSKMRYSNLNLLYNKNLAHPRCKVFTTSPDFQIYSQIADSNTPYFSPLWAKRFFLTISIVPYHVVIPLVSRKVKLSDVKVVGRIGKIIMCS